MEEFFTALERSLAERNWYAALTLSLTLPDICAQAEQPGVRTGGKDYKAWVEKHLVPTYTGSVGYPPETMTFLSAGDCYALRCALLHGGSTDIEGQSAREVLKRFVFLSPGARGMSWHRNWKDDVLILMVNEFATDVLRAARAWWKSLDSDQRGAAHAPLIVVVDADQVEGI